MRFDVTVFFLLCLQVHSSFFSARFAYFRTHASFTFFIGLFILFILAVPMRECLGNLEFPISYSHTEWYLLFSWGEIVPALAEASPIKI